MDFFYYLWFAIQVAIGYNLLLPFIFYLVWKLLGLKYNDHIFSGPAADYAIIVTAYEQIHTLPFVVDSILKLDYSNYVVYIVADKCDVTNLHFTDPRIVLLRPPETLASNTKSHRYAISHFIRVHDRITIIDSDNLIDKNYLNQLNLKFDQKFVAVQGIRKAKNLNTTLSCLDAARDIYYHFYDGKMLFELGSSATLSGSGMAFDLKIYSDFINNNQIEGAGFDKVLQAWLVKQNYRIAFSENAIVYDEKTSKSEQLIQQRSRWINTWFKYFKLGFSILFVGIKNFNKNQFLFGIVLLRPPLFIFLIFALLALCINVLLGFFLGFILWAIGLLIFIVAFFVALMNSEADQKIYHSLLSIPQFIFYQIVSLMKIGKANKISVATKHYFNEEHDQLN